MSRFVPFKYFPATRFTTPPRLCGRWLLHVSHMFTGSLVGISFKTQALYVAVFVARYPDLLFRYISVYNSAMKLFFIASSCYILYLMRYRYRSVLFHCACFVANAPIADQHMTPPSTRSALNTFSVHALSWAACSTTSLHQQRFCGVSPSSWRQWRFFLSFSCCNAPERRKQSRLTTWPRWACIGLCTFPIGYTGELGFIISVNDVRNHCFSGIIQKVSWTL